MRRAARGAWRGSVLRSSRRAEVKRLAWTTDARPRQPEPGGDWADGTVKIGRPASFAVKMGMR